MASIFVYDYNSYYNRKVKKEDTLDKYGEPVYFESTTNLNFNANDGVSAGYVAGKLNNPYDDDGNYLIYSADNTNITSRWFIVESVRLRGGQYQLRLLRDTIADYYDAVLNAKSFIQKATLTDDNPLIYTQEAISTNQIKTKEQLLYDESKSAWIVGYVARNASYTNTGTDKAQHPHRMNLTPSAVLADIEVASLGEWEYNKYVNGELWRNLPDPDLETCINAGKPSTKHCYRNGNHINENLDITPSTHYLIYQISPFNSWFSSSWSSMKTTINNYKKLYFDRTVNLSDYNSIAYLDGKILKAGNNVYKIHAKIETLTYKTLITADKQGTYLRTYFTNLFKNARGVETGQYASEVPLRLVYKANGIRLTLEPVVSDTYYIDFPETTERYNLRDAPYDMFCMRYADSGIITFGPASGSITPTNKDLNLAIAQEVSRALDSQCYDVQLLPYCPFTGYTMSGTTMNISDTSDRRKTEVYNQNNELISTLIWCLSSSGTKNIILDEPLKIYNKKISNQCDIYRLVSPNYNGQFEFNLAKNDIKELSVFNVDYTYLPYNPYIHVNPQFSGLYGEDYNDARGLICGGDFSLARITDAWQSYQLQNKNYQNIFDRQIQNMDFNRKYQRAEDWIGAVAGSFQASMQGFVASGGSPWGAIAGGVAGLGGGIADAMISENKYQESKSYATDVHNMQLENVRALPYSISKTTAFTANNKVFVILEYYTCTDTEKMAVAKEIANQGMIVGANGTIADYVYNSWSYEDINDRGFIRAIPIELDIIGDSHIANAISEELQKGVYFK